jgi:small GTP-binding protein
MDRLYRLIEFNEMQMQLLERATTLMGRELTNETRDGWMRDFQQLRAALLAPQIARLLHRSSIPELPIVFNVVVVGEPGVGKSTFLKRLSGQNDHRRVYIQTGTPEPHLIVHRNAVPGSWTEYEERRYHFNIRDVSGRMSNVQPDEHLRHADVAWVFFDVSSRSTYRQIPVWIDLVHSVRPECKIIVCANKSDLYESSSRIQVPFQPMKWVSKPVEHNGVQYPCVLFSSRTLYHHEYPFTTTLRLFRNDGLQV